MVNKKMKKYIAFTLAFVMAALLFGCGKKENETLPQETTTTQAKETTAPKETEKETETEVATEDKEETVEPVHVILKSIHKGTYNKDTNEREADTTYVLLSLSEDYSKKYSELSKGLLDYSKKEEAEREKSFEDLKLSYIDANEYRDDKVSVTDEVKAKVFRADSSIVSVYHEYYGYWGGAHGMYTYSGENFDSKTGKLLSITDVITDMDKFIEAVHEKIKTKYSEEYEYMNDFNEFMGYHKEDNYVNLCFSMDGEGLTVYFNPYDLGAYAMGALNVTLYYDELKGLAKEEYLKIADDYIIPLTFGKDVEIDTDGDGKREKVYIEEKADEYSAYEYTLFRGDASLVITDYAYSQESYVVKSKGKYYLYFFERTDNDYVLLNIVDLKTMNFDRDKTVFASLCSLDYSYTNNEEKCLYIDTQTMEGFSDPTSFVLGTHLDVLSTTTGKKTYYVGDDGYPKSEDKYYRISNTIVMKTLKDISCDVVDAKGKKYKDGKIPSGSYISVVGSNDNNIAFVQIVDPSKVEVTGDEDYKMYYLEDTFVMDESKEIYKLNIDKSDWPFKVQGIEESLLLEGQIYAG